MKASMVKSWLHGSIYIFCIYRLHGHMWIQISSLLHLLVTYCDENLVSSEDNLNLSINWYHYLSFSFQARLINKSSNVCTKQGERTVQLNGMNGFISKSPEALNESQGFTITIHLSQTPGDRGWVSCCCSVILHIRSRNPIFRFSLWCGAAAASWSVCSPLDWVAWVQALARDNVLCSWARHLTPTYGASLHPGVKTGTGKLNILVTLRGLLVVFKC